MKQKQIELGDEVQDVITKRKGTVVSMRHSIWRCRQPVVYFQDFQGKGQDRTVCYDAGQLKLLKSGVIKPNKDTSDMPVIEFGDEVEDLISGYKGICVAREEFLFRCDRIQVQPRLKAGDNKLDEGFEMDCQSVKIIKKNVVKKEKTSEPQKTAGAPMSKAGGHGQAF